MSNEKPEKKTIDDLLTFKDFNAEFDYDRKIKTHHSLIQERNYHPCSVFKILTSLTKELREHKKEYWNRPLLAPELGLAIPHRTRIQERISLIGSVQTHYLERCIETLDEREKALSDKERNLPKSPKPW